MTATELKHGFDLWFSREYHRLKERLALTGILDEDAFHDAYLSLRQSFKGVGLEQPSFPNIFSQAYSRIRGHQISEDFVISHPNEVFFMLLPSESSEPQENPRKRRDRRLLVADIRMFVRKSFPTTVSIAWENRYVSQMPIKAIQEITGQSRREVMTCLKTANEEVCQRFSHAI